MQFFSPWKKREEFLSFFFKFLTFLLLHLKYDIKIAIFSILFCLRTRGRVPRFFNFLSLPHPKNVIKSAIFPVWKEWGKFENFFSIWTFSWLLKPKNWTKIFYHFYFVKREGKNLKIFKIFFSHPKNVIKNAILSCLKGGGRIPKFFQLSTSSIRKIFEVPPKWEILEKFHWHDWKSVQFQKCSEFPSKWCSGSATGTVRSTFISSHKSDPPPPWNEGKFIQASIGKIVSFLYLK